MVEKYEPRQMTRCPICGKSFWPAVEHAWKIKRVKGGRHQLVCTYSCMRVWEKEREKKSKARKDNKND